MNSQSNAPSPADYVWRRIVMEYKRRRLYTVRFEGDHGTGTGEIEIDKGQESPTHVVMVARTLAMDYNCEVLVIFEPGVEPRRVLIQAPSAKLAILGGRSGEVH